MKINLKDIYISLGSLQYLFHHSVPAVINVALGQHAELKDKRLVSNIIRRCPDPKDVVLLLEL